MTDVPFLEIGGDNHLVDLRTGHRKPVVRRIQYYTLLLILDLIAISAAFVVASWLRPENPTSREVLLAVLPIYAVTAFNSRAYSIDALCQPRQGMAAALLSLLLAFSALFLIYNLLRTDQGISRLVLFAAMIMSAALIVLQRVISARFILPRSSSSFLVEVVLIDGMQIPRDQACIYAEAKALGLTPNLRDPALLNRFAKMMSGVDRVVIACRPERRKAWAMLLKGANIRGEVLADEFDAVAAFGINRIGDNTTLVVASGPLHMRQRIVKRVFDLAVCLPLLFAFGPLLALVAIAIKMDSRGPVFFMQRRVGRANAFFEIYKFRSMHANASDADGHVSARRDDQRVTRLGKIIRRTSIDELPQLFNVLLGSMSLVGPRPHALGSLAGEELFWDVDERYWHRHALKPGITGLAQVRGLRGATHRRDDLTLRLQADLEYAANWSIWRDIVILVSTLKVLVGRSAY